MADDSEAGEVDIVSVSVPSGPAGTRSSDLAQLGAWLSDAERVRVQRLRRPEDRLRSVTGYATVRYLLGGRLGLDPRAVSLDANESGKPRLAPGSPSDLRFNISHAGQRVLVAISSGREVGVDVEEIRSDAGIEDIALHFFSDEERAVLESLPSARRTTAGFTCWTLKEAYLKAQGGGLDQLLSEFTVLATRPRGDTDRDFAVVSNIGGWALGMLQLHDGYVGAVAAAGSSPLPSTARLLPLTTLLAAG